jgi:hypothetical protein
MPQACARGCNPLVLQLLVSRSPPGCDRSVGCAKIVFLARVLEDHIGCGLKSPRSNVRPVLCVSLGIVNGHRMLDCVGIRSKESSGNLQILAMRMACSIQPGVAVEFNCFDDECVSVPMTGRLSIPGLRIACGPLRAIRRHPNVPGVLFEKESEGIVVLHNL